MKVAFITFEYPPFVQGGAGVYAHNLVTELARLGHEVHVITPRASGGEREALEEGVFIHRLGFLNKPFLAVVSFWVSLRKEFASLKKQTGGFDIVHSNGLSAFSLGQKALSSPSVITIHHLTRTTLRTLGANLPARIRNLRGEAGISPLIEPLCIRRADRIITVSQFTRRDISHAYGIPESRIEVIYHGARPENYVLPEEARLRLRSNLGIESQPMILFVGRLVPRKGVDILLRALPQVIKEMDAKLVLAGSGNQKDYRRLAQALNIPDKVIFLGHVPDDTLSLLYSSCDLFVLPSRLEGLGIVVLEAMAAGKPVIATNAGGIPELVETGHNGILIEAGEAEELASAITRVLGDKSLARAIGKNNTSKVREHYSWEVAARKAVHLYSDLIKK
jgi:glycosyltransferase involved in cell wall biosynthesis